MILMNFASFSETRLREINTKTVSGNYGIHYGLIRMERVLTMIQSPFIDFLYVRQVSSQSEAIGFWLISQISKKDY